MEMKKVDDDEHDYGHEPHGRHWPSNKQQTEIWRIRPVGRKASKTALRSGHKLA